MPPQLIVGHGSVGLGAGVTRFQDAGFEQGIQRGLGIALLESQQSHAGERNVIAGIGLERGIERLLGLRIAVREGLERAEFALISCAVGIELQRRRKIASRRRRILTLALRAPQREPAAIVGGSHTRRALELLECLLSETLAARGFACRYQYARRIRVARQGERLFRGIDLVHEQLLANQLRQQIGIARGDGQGFSGDCERTLEFSGYQFDVGEQRVDVYVASASPAVGLQPSVGPREIAVDDGRERRFHRGRCLGCLGISSWFYGQSVHPLNAVARIGEQNLDRRFAELGQRGFVFLDRDAALSVKKLHGPGEHHQQSLAGRIDFQFPVRPADCGDGVRRVDDEIG